MSLASFPYMLPNNLGWWTCVKNRHLLPCANKGDFILCPRVFSQLPSRHLIPINVHRKLHLHTSFPIPVYDDASDLCSASLKRPYMAAFTIIGSCFAISCRAWPRYVSTRISFSGSTLISTISPGLRSWAQAEKFFWVKQLHKIHRGFCWSGDCNWLNPYDFACKGLYILPIHSFYLISKVK